MSETTTRHGVAWRAHLADRYGTGYSPAYDYPRPAGPAPCAHVFMRTMGVLNCQRCHVDASVVLGGAFRTYTQQWALVEAPITLSVGTGGTAPNPWAMRRDMDAAEWPEVTSPPPF